MKEDVAEKEPRTSAKIAAGDAWISRSKSLAQTMTLTRARFASNLSLILEGTIASSRMARTAPCGNDL